MPTYCERHTVAIYDRGGTKILGSLENLASVQWSRERDNISTARVVVTNPGPGCSKLLNEISCNRHEMVIFRGPDRVWEGPITLIGRYADTFEISARDVCHYLHRTVMHAEYDNAAYWSPDDKDPNRVFVDNTGPVVDRTINVMTAELARKEAQDPPINVLPHMIAVRAANIADERESNRKTPPFSMTVLDDMETAATYGGLDYTAVGRRIIVNDNRVILGRTAPVSEKDFLSEVVITSYGMDSFTRAFTTGDEGMYGVYPPIGGTGDLTPEEIAAAEYYGEWENVEQMFDEDSEEAPSQNSLDNAARYNMVGRLPVPTLVRIPENSTLNPNGTLSLQDLVPGVIIPVRATLTSIVLIQNQKLGSVSVKEDSEGEEISVSLGPPPGSFLERA